MGDEVGVGASPPLVYYHGVLVHSLITVGWCPTLH